MDFKISERFRFCGVQNIKIVGGGYYTVPTSLEIWRSRPEELFLFQRLYLFGYKDILNGMNVRLAFDSIKEPTTEEIFVMQNIGAGSGQIVGSREFQYEPPRLPSHPRLMLDVYDGDNTGGFFFNIFLQALVYVPTR